MGGIGNNGLWAVWHTVQNDKYVWSDPVSLGSIFGGETKVLAFPPGIDVKTSELVIYDDILNGYLTRSKVSKNSVLNDLVSATYYSQYPLVRVPLPSLASTNSSLLKPIDTDKDGVPDYLDAFKSDPKWAYDTDKDGMPDGWEIQYGLNIYDPADAVKDKDGDGYSNLYEFKSNTSPADKNSKPVPVIAKIVPLTGKVGQTVTLNVSGSNLPSTIVANIAKQTVGCSTATKSATAATFTCPLSVVGSQTLAVKTNTQANGGTVISGGTATFVVSPALTAPQNLKAIPGDGKITLQWDNVPGLGYSGCVSTQSPASEHCSSGFQSLQLDWYTNPDPIASHTVDNLINGQKYYISLAWVDHGVESPVVEVSATPQKASGTTGKLNDTGITTCSNATQNNLPCPQAGFPGQDAEHGRDANQATNNDVDGHRGFSFTKISSTGAELPASATEWSCVKDNVTGLMWEVKQGVSNGIYGDTGLHDPDDKFAWYEPDSSKNGGDAGDANDHLNVNYSNTCYGYIRGKTANLCNTKAYVDRVNVAGWCGIKSWRMPTVDELSGIVALNRYSPAVDITYFPDMPSTVYSLDFLTSSPVVSYSTGQVWVAGFDNGSPSWVGSGAVRWVRLVHDEK